MRSSRIPPCWTPVFPWPSLGNCMEYSKRAVFKAGQSASGKAALGTNNLKTRTKKPPSADGVDKEDSVVYGVRQDMQAAGLCRVGAAGPQALYSRFCGFRCPAVWAD
ncbi:hypothetical protein GCM10010841_22880 [Deinococcus aerophilus]|uniref:Uncharacterized protein n=1 Tax=Deinococcus aerophilus TaxID=522488 RepID=A0ABQ2GUC6_9DEIO|nr:hypothetical protein GCM10010841_22880 [Deinococcus aerophilus]